jgi:hypothetical protein
MSIISKYILRKKDFAVARNRVRPLRRMLIKNTDDFQMLLKEIRFYSGQTHKM